MLATTVLGVGKCKYNKVNNTLNSGPNLKIRIGIKFALIKSRHYNEVK